MKSGRASWHFKLALVAMGLGLVVLTELALRWLHPLPGATSGFKGSPPCFIEERQRDGSLAYVLHPARRHSFAYQSFSAERTPDSFLVFCVGGSSVYGFPYGAEVSFPLRLEELLRSRHPEHRWEIINVGGLSYGTERLRLLVEELVRYRPHLLILYTGHNEFIEKDFYTGRRQTTRVLGRVCEVAGRLHLFRALESTLWRPPEPSAQEAMAFGINVVRREGHLPTSEEKTAAAARYQTNIKAILNSAHDHRVLPILCTVSSNLAGWRPGAGSFSPMLEDTPLLNASLALARASAAEQVGDREGALRALNQTLGIDPNHSEIHYRAGRLLRELRRPTEAKIHFRAALELDATPIRAFAAFNTVLREIARGQAVELVDIARAFESKCRDGIPDNTLFWDYCHPNMLGHELIALRLLPVVERLLGL